MASARWNHTATRLADGRVLVVGGFAPGRNAESHAPTELFDPVTDTWSSAGTLPVSLQFHAAVALSDGRAIVIGGSRDEGSEEVPVEGIEPTRAQRPGGF
jgi:hypothetical protein